MSWLLLNIPNPSADEAAVIRRYRIGTVMPMYSAWFPTTFTNTGTSGDWPAFATEQDFVDAVDADVSAFVAANEAKIAPSSHIMVDIENAVAQRFWTSPGTSTPEDRSRFVYIAQAVRSATGRKVGFYNFPERNWYTPTQQIPANIQAWHDKDDLYQEFIDELDVLMPSMYFIVDNLTVQNLQNYAREMMHNCLRMAHAAGGKDVFPVVTYNEQFSGGGDVSGATWATFVPALWVATEESPSGASGSQHIQGIFMWTGLGHTLTQLRSSLNWMLEYSPRDRPKAL